jgi:magnesium transporter
MTATLKTFETDSTYRENDIKAALQAHDYPRLQILIRNYPGPTLAQVIRGLQFENQVVFFRLLQKSAAASAFEYLTIEEQRALLKAMGQDEVAAILNEMAPDDRTTLFDELPATVTKQLLTLLGPEERSTAIQLLGYPELSIGRLMTPHYVEVHKDWTVQKVLDFVRENGKDSETLNVIYVTDDEGKLIDDIRIREFLLAPTEKLVQDLMDYRYVHLSAKDPQSVAVKLFKDEDRKALPVIDSEGFLIGIVTIDDVLAVSEETATNEIQRIGGTESLDEPYMKISLFRMVKKRGGWLVILFLGEMLTATAMGFFEGEIAKAVVLALFVPLIISSGGNSGSQATTLIIRALALGEVTLKDWWKVLRREIITGLLLGVVLGTIGFLRIGIWSAFSPIYGPHWMLVALTVGTSLIGIVMWGSVAGSMLPFILRKVGFDPATASAPFVATLVDVTGLIIYFTSALIFLKGSLL